MRRFLCQLVPIVLLSGCFLSHELDEGTEVPDPDPLPCPTPDLDVCCGPSGEVPIIGEACAPIACPEGATPSSGSCPVPPELMCPEARADFTCLQSPSAHPGEAFRLPYSFDDAHCCGSTECSVEVREGELHLTTTRCEGLCACAATLPGPRGECEVPGLAEGDWPVFVNGAFAYELPVVRDAELMPVDATCVQYATADNCGGSPQIFRATWHATQACLEDNNGQHRIRLTTDQWDCTRLDGPCETRVIDEGIPGERVLQVFPTYFGSACDLQCGGGPFSHEGVCNLPTLEPGITYRVQGAMEFSFDPSAGLFCASDPHDG